LFIEGRIPGIYREKHRPSVIITNRFAEKFSNLPPTTRWVGSNGK
jgi:hypothetical protein